MDSKTFLCKGCLNNYDQLYYLSCGHSFCHDCSKLDHIEEAKKNPGEIKCSQCFQVINTKWEIHPYISDEEKKQSMLIISTYEEMEKFYKYILNNETEPLPTEILPFTQLILDETKDTRLKISECKSWIEWAKTSLILYPKNVECFVKKIEEYKSFIGTNPIVVKLVSPLTEDNEQLIYFNFYKKTSVYDDFKKWVNKKKSYYSKPHLDGYTITQYDPVTNLCIVINNKDYRCYIGQLIDGKFYSIDLLGGDNNFVIKNLNNAYILRQTFYGKLVTLYHLDISLKKITFVYDFGNLYKGFTNVELFGDIICINSNPYSIFFNTKTNKIKNSIHTKDVDNSITEFTMGEDNNVYMYQCNYNSIYQCIRVVKCNS